MKIRVAVIYGGRTGEHEVSVRSAQAILAGLDPAKYEKIEYFIDKEGKWSPSAILPEPGAHPGIDVVFPVLHGTFGEDGTMQGLLELAGLPYVGMESYPGKIIAIEGTDGVGRSTQIRLLREWLEVQGYGVVETGWTRSALMQPTIEPAKSSNTLNKLTFVLLYATDFADRLEKEIIPALKAGFVVLSDRYIFSALARAAVRGVDRAWLRSLYGFAIAPHLVFYLKTDVDTLIRRVLSARGMDFWESGMDMSLSRDWFDCFDKYQRLIHQVFESLQKKSFETLLYSTIGIVAMFLILVAVNFLTGRVIFRWDPIAYLEHKRWKNFRKFLKDFSAIEQAPVNLLGHSLPCRTLRSLLATPLRPLLVEFDDAPRRFLR